MLLPRRYENEYKIVFAWSMIIGNEATVYGFLSYQEME